MHFMFKLISIIPSKYLLEVCISVSQYGVKYYIKIKSNQFSDTISYLQNCHI